jgi:hypothetical protein
MSKLLMAIFATTFAAAATAQIPAPADPAAATKAKQDAVGAAT